MGDFCLDSERGEAGLAGPCSEPHSNLIANRGLELRFDVPAMGLQQQLGISHFHQLGGMQEHVQVQLHPDGRLGGTLHCQEEPAMQADQCFHSRDLVQLGVEFQSQDPDLEVYQVQPDIHLFHPQPQPFAQAELLPSGSGHGVEEPEHVQSHDQFEGRGGDDNGRFFHCKRAESASPGTDYDDEGYDLVVDGRELSLHERAPETSSDGGMRPATPSSPAQLDAQTRREKRMKQVHIRLDVAAHRNLMKLVTEQHNGSLEEFVNTTIAAGMLRSKQVPVRKPAITKWKRLRFDQLKGTETRELALAYRCLAESFPGLQLTTCLLETSWEDLTMAQMKKMLEETKQMLVLMEKQHTCPEAECGRHFPTPGMLRDHMNEHSGDRPYVCTFEGCSSSFARRQFLCRHMKMHQCAFLCPVDGCSKRFAFRERLVAHQKTHESDRPLSCPYEGCGKTFKWLNSLNGHLRTHTGEKPFKCLYPECGRDFGYKVDLTRHERTHYGQLARVHR